MLDSLTAPSTGFLDLDQHPEPVGRSLKNKSLNLTVFLSPKDAIWLTISAQQALVPSLDVFLRLHRTSAKILSNKKTCLRLCNKNSTKVGLGIKIKFLCDLKSVLVWSLSDLILVKRHERLMCDNSRTSSATPEQSSKSSRPTNVNLLHGQIKPRHLFIET